MEQTHARHRHFVVLEVGRSNLGRGAPRIPAERLCESWNQLLVDVPAGPQFSHGYGHTGNYLLDCVDPVSLPQVVDLLNVRISRRLAIFTASDYCEWLD